MKTATFIRSVGGWNGDARLYRLSEAVECERRDARGEFTESMTDYVIVSKTDNFVTETYIFPANEDGKPLSMLDLPGSMKGDVSHEDALSEAGFTVTS